MAAERDGLLGSRANRGVVNFGDCGFWITFANVPYPMKLPRGENPSLSGPESVPHPDDIIIDVRSDRAQIPGAPAAHL